MRTVVTGGAGFIGRALVRTLLHQAGDAGEIYLVDSLARHGHQPDLDVLLEDRRVRLVRADLTASSALDAVPPPVDRVYHLAAIVGVGPVLAAPATVLRANTLTTLSVFDWFVRNGAKRSRLLFASSSEVYAGAALAGLPLPIPTDENVPAVIAEEGGARSSYALSKLWGETYARCLSTSDGPQLASVRFHNVYGPGMGFDHVIPQVIARIAAREDPFRVIAAEETRSFCWVDDAAEATRLVMESSRLTPGMVVHIGNEHAEITIAALYEMLFDVCGWRPRVQIQAASAPGSVARRCPSVARLRELTGYDPTTSLRDGLPQTARWYLDHSSPRHATA